MSQAIVTKYKGTTARSLSPTITARTQGSSAKVLYQDAAGIGAAHCHAAHELAIKLGWRGTWVGGALPDGSGYAFVLVDQATDVVEVSVPPEVTGIPSEKLRACLRWLDYSRLGEAFERIADSPAKLVAVWAAVSAGAWDVFADQLSLRQVREAIKGIVPQFEEGPNGLVPIYEKRKR